MRSPQGWSLRQVQLAAGVSRADARLAHGRGLLGEQLHRADVLVLRVATAVTAFAPVAERTPANRARPLHPRELRAAELARAAAAEPPGFSAVLAVTADDAATLTVASGGLNALLRSEQVLMLPLGAWARELGHLDPMLPRRTD